MFYMWLQYLSIGGLLVIVPSTYRDQYFGEGGGRRHMGPPLVFLFILI